MTSWADDWLTGKTKTVKAKTVKTPTAKATHLKRLRIYSANPKWATIKKKYTKLMGTGKGSVEATKLRNDIVKSYKQLRTLYGKNKSVRFSKKKPSVRNVPYETRLSKDYNKLSKQAKKQRAKDRMAGTIDYVKSRNIVSQKQRRMKGVTSRKEHYMKERKRLGKLGINKRRHNIPSTRRKARRTSIDIIKKYNTTNT